MSLDALVAELRADPAFMRNVTAWRTLAPRLARTMPWPAELDARLAEAGRALGVAQLYAHQAQAVAAALRGENVALATGAASGKTLGYTLPVLHTLLRDPQATALLLFPTKALAHDQIAAMEAWLAQPALQGAPIPLRPYDGDTPTRHRAQIRREARVLVSNPDMLHIGILPHHPRWARFFRGLRYVVLDELHTYRGVFGGHVANVLRRLLRIAHFHGANPQVISASATIANPAALAERLTGRDFVTLGGEADAAAYGRRHVIFYNPPLLASADAAPRVRGKHNPELGLRASAADEAIQWTLRLLRADVQTILFARSRLMVELLLSKLRERVARAGDDPDVIQGYRGGYLPSERRVIERDLREGRTRVVVATNALELGIDIGALDAAILVGYPGSIAATHQQMGRAGRRAATSLSMMIATPSPLDQYLVAHPDYFFGRSPEEARIDPDTLSLLASHLTCAAFELPFEAGEPFGSAENVEDLLAALSAEGLLHRRDGRFTWVGESYPAQSVSLRTATPDNVVIRTSEGRVIGTMDRPSAPRMVHEGAVYVHGGEAYLITALDWEQGIASAEPAELGYYTVASEAVEVERLDVHREVRPGGVQLSDEAVLVHSEPTIYRRVRMTTRETLGWGEIDLPAQEMETVAFRVALGAELVAALADAGVMVAPLDYGPEWPRIRREILARDGERCRLCDAAARPGHPWRCITSRRCGLSLAISARGGAAIRPRPGEPDHAVRAVSSARGAGAGRAHGPGRIGHAPAQAGAHLPDVRSRRFRDDRRSARRGADPARDPALRRGPGRRGPDPAPGGSVAHVGRGGRCAPAGVRLLARLSLVRRPRRRERAGRQIRHTDAVRIPPCRFLSKLEKSPRLTFATIDCNFATD